jgi:predicted nucleic acid-binding protein
LTALDTNVVIALERAPSHEAETVLRAIERAAGRGKIVICGAVFAELCASPGSDPSDVAHLLAAARVAIDFHLPEKIWADAGIAYGTYALRRKETGGGSPRRILADFIIGAHAKMVGSLVTSDGRFFRRAFPDLLVFDVRDKS